MTLSQRAVEAAARAIMLQRTDEIENRKPRATYTELATLVLNAALAVDGLCLAPKEPSDAMREAGAKFSAVCCAETGCIVGGVYRAMIAAASDGDSPPQEKI